LVSALEYNRRITPPQLPTPKHKSDGGSTDYYKTPEGAEDLQDLIEYKDMRWNVANIFKACYRLGEKADTDVMYDLNKMAYFIERERKRVSKQLSLSL